MKVLILSSIVFSVLFIGFSYTADDFILNQINPVHMFDYEVEPIGDLYGDVLDLKGSITSLEIPFIKNMGHLNPDVRYYADTFVGRVFLSDDKLTYVLSGDTSYIITETPNVGMFGNIEGLKESSTNVSYFVGNDADKWQSNTPTFHGVSLGETWSGVDVSLYAYGNNVEKIFTVMPGFDSSEIQLSFNGISKIQLDKNGNLVLYSLEDNSSVMSMSAPIAYQEINGEKIDVAVNYKIIDNVSYGFAVGDYDDTQPLTIDPLIQSTWIGSSGKERTVSDASLDDNDDVFLIDHFNHGTQFPYTDGGAIVNPPGQSDVVIMKISNDLKTILQVTYLGGADDDAWAELAIGSSGDVYISGETNATATFPGATGTFHGKGDIFVSHLSNDLTELKKSLIFGGTGYDENFKLDIDSNGDLFIYGETNSTSIDRITGGNMTSNPGGNPNEDDESIRDTSLFITKVKGDLSTVMQSTFLGGTGNDRPSDLEIDPFDNIIVVGYTNSTNFSGTTDASFQENLIQVTEGEHDGETYGHADIFVSKLGNDLKSAHSTYVGSENFEAWPNMVIDDSGTIYVGTETKGLDTFPGIDTSSAYGTDTATDGVLTNVIFKIDNNLSTVKSTFLPFTSAQGFSDLAIDSQGNVYGTSQSGGSDLPKMTGGTFVDGDLGGVDLFIVKFSADLSTLLQTTLAGTSNRDDNPLMLIDSNDDVFLLSSGRNNAVLPGVEGGAQETSNNGGGEFFVMKFSNDLLSVEALAELLSSGGGGCNDCTPPTFGKNKAGALVVSGGFAFNSASPVDVSDYHTEFPLITVITNVTNTATVKIYENQGVSNIALVQFGLGMPEAGSTLENAQTLVELWLDDTEIEEIIKIDKNNLVDIIDVTTSIVDCGIISSDCLEVSLEYVYRDQPKYNVMAINAMDLYRNSQTNYLNDGILVKGESLNEPLTQNVSVSQSNPLYPQKSGVVILSLLDYKTDVWIDQFGYQWSTNQYGPYLLDEIPIPEKIPDKYSKWNGYNDRMHSEFPDYIQQQIVIAQKISENLNPPEVPEIMREKIIPIFVFDRTDRYGETIDEIKKKEALRAITAFEKQLESPRFDEYHKPIDTRTVSEILAQENAMAYQHIPVDSFVEITLKNDMLTISGNVGNGDKNIPVLVNSTNHPMRTIPVNNDGSFYIVFMSNIDVHVTVEHMGVILEKYIYNNNLR